MNASRPRVLLFPTASKLEWPILSSLEEWADVAVISGAWLEDGQAARDAVAELDRRGWPAATVVSDEWGIVKSVELARANPDRIEALAIGHACLALRTTGPRPTLNPDVVDAFTQLLQTNFSMWARALTQSTRGDYDDGLVDRFLQETPQEDALAMMGRIRARDGESFEDALRELSVPMLLAWHKECLLWTDEGFHDASAALPHAQTVATTSKCSASPEFADALRAFCTSLAA